MAKVRGKANFNPEIYAAESPYADDAVPMTRAQAEAAYGDDPEGLDYFLKHVGTLDQGGEARPQRPSPWRGEPKRMPPKGMRHMSDKEMKVMSMPKDKWDKMKAKHGVKD